MTEQTPAPNDENLLDDDLDVEGHGLKEVAAGLSTAAILASGGAAVMHAAGSSGGIDATIHAGPASVSVQADPSQAQDVTQGAVAQAHTTEAAAAQAAHDATTSVSLPNNPPPNVAGTAAHAVGNVSNTVSHTVARAESTVAGDVAKVKATADNDVAAAVTAVHTTQGQVQQVAGAVTTAAHQTETHAVTTLHATMHEGHDAVAGAKSAVVNLSKPGANGSVNATDATGTVTVSDNGVVVGTATLTNGTATLHWTAPVGGSHTMTFSYSGDGLHAPSSFAV